MYKLPRSIHWLHVSFEYFHVWCFFLFFQLTSAHKRHGTPPHRMFAMDTIVRIAINLALQNVSPGR